MGDRTDIWLEFNKADEAMVDAGAMEACGAPFDDKMDRSVYVKARMSDVNYGGESLYAWLNVHHVPFVAFWANGDTYGPGLIACDGWDRRDIECTQNGYPVVMVDPPDTPCARDLSSARVYFRLRDKVIRLLAMVPEEYLTAKRRMASARTAMLRRQFAAKPMPGNRGILAAAGPSAGPSARPMVRRMG